ncbi:MAG: MotA/TolQ/ExbB proton channel family protein, partial [Proteobacteria bacterium]|nr:MotA/TolQ/ExbB proton channel family protein [Pseudomonadota bacterium]
MKKNFPTEFVYQVFSLLIAIIIVHAIYVAVIRP